MLTNNIVSFEQPGPIFEDRSRFSGLFWTWKNIILGQGQNYLIGKLRKTDLDIYHISLVIRGSINNSKNLNPSYKTDLDLQDFLGKVKLIVKISYDWVGYF